MKKAIKIIIIVILSLSILSLIYYNMKSNSEFFTVSISVLINVILAIAITYYFTQRKHDERKQKDIVTSIIIKLQEYLDKECAYRIKDIRDYRMNSRSISNAIDALKKCNVYETYKDDLEYIENQFKEYRELIGNHESEREFLEDAETDFVKYLKNMSSRLDTILVELYNKK